MSKKSKIKKLQTKHSLQWYLNVGASFGSLTKHRAIQLSKVRPVTFQRWMDGKLAAPEATLSRIKLHAFHLASHARLRTFPRNVAKHEKSLVSHTEHVDARHIEAVFFWKQMIFNELNAIGRRRVYSALKRLQRA